LDYGEDIIDFETYNTYSNAVEYKTDITIDDPYKTFTNYVKNYTNTNNKEEIKTLTDEENDEKKQEIHKRNEEVFKKYYSKNEKNKIKIK